ncbi:GNAT family N-acetyltransferase [Kaistia dalseonensis]|uniref:RimJ/RimL family protein N-acetyltransferase n=1 Tax=Kaistia dalseonensis TaxID=410840 RepID=A0ABU0H4N2_9HYPH|nr:GNAT family N-acetyltransferase [Kaistia dalseonensis]MCX5494685.1 GNAT family N-acetyltransferase [Kaistia dalseonensis]MDQ0437266.1 RimJ/RimL family protein N-acetyltransferase [Kaistia dalseonensis]
MRDDASEETSEGEERRLLTRRLILRPPGIQDAAALAAAIDNPRVAMNLVTVPYPYRRTDAEIWIERERSVEDAPGASHIAISRNQGGLVGAGFHRPSTVWPDGFELSFWVAERFWGQGFGTEIAHAVIDDAFVRGGVMRLICAIRVTNGSARRVVEKCGFQFRDTGMVRSIATRGAVPVERFVLERRVWQSLKAWGAERVMQDFGPARIVEGSANDVDESSAA